MLNLPRLSIAPTILLFLLTLVTINVQAQCTACTITVNGSSSSNYNLGNGDHLCIASGTYTGSITRLHRSGSICIAAGATFNPQNLNNWKGPIYNYGTLILSNANMTGGAAVYNYGDATINGVDMVGSTVIEVGEGGELTVNTNLTIGGNANVVINGSLTTGNELNIEGSGALTNNGSIVVGTNFNMKKTFVNNGYFEVNGAINFDNNTDLTNNCVFYAKTNFSFSQGAFTNEGLLYIPNHSFANSGTIAQGPNGLIYGKDFANSGNINGSGNYYFTHHTENSGLFGHDAEGINFYDASLLGSTYFDVQSAAPHNTVTKNAFTPADPSTWAGSIGANAGGDRVVCRDTVYMDAVGDGTWTIISGSGNIFDVHDPKTLVTNLGLGSNKFEWTTESPCGSAVGDVNITYEVADTTTWTGTVSNIWNDDRNWTHCIPAKTTVTFIPSTTTDPIIKGGRVGYSLKLFVAVSADLTVKSGAALRIAED